MVLVNIKWESDSIVGLGCNGVCAQKDCSRLPSLKQTNKTGLMEDAGLWKQSWQDVCTCALGCGVPTSSLLSVLPHGNAQPLRHRLGWHMERGTDVAPLCHTGLGEFPNPAYPRSLCSS